jgi:iron complex outermembrane receptor protein
MKGLAWILVAGVWACGSVMGAADAPPAEEPPAKEAAPAETAAEAGPSIPTEVVKVETTLPYVPTSNTIAAKLPLELDLTPFNIGIVEGALLREQNARSLGESLLNVSGINAQTQSGLADYFLIRGYDSLSSGLVLTDGAAEPEATYYQVYNVDRVEVLKGPGGFLYGGNPMAGTVNMVRKQPNPGDFGTFGLGGGSLGTAQATVDLNLTGPGDDFSFRVNGLFRDAENYRDDKESTQVGINPSFAWRRGENQTFNFNLEYLRSDFSPDSGIPLLSGSIPEVDRRTSYQSSFDFSEQDIYRAQLDWEARRSERLTFRDKLYFRSQDWQTDGTFFNAVIPLGPPTGPLVSRTLGELDDEQRVIGNQFEAVLDLETGRVGHKIMTGIELTRYTDQFVLDASCLSTFNPLLLCDPDIALFNPVETATGTTPIPGARTVGDAEGRVIAPYVIDQMSLSPRFQLLLGARYDVIDFEDPSRGLKSDEGELSPTAGLVFSGTRGYSLYANASQSFAPPSPRAAGGLEPEESEQLEVGARKSFLSGRLRTTLALYQLDRANIAITDDTGFTQQLGDQRSRGVEIEISGEPVPGLRTFFTYAYTDAELTRFPETKFVGLDFTDPNNPVPIFATFDRAGNSAAFAPEHLAGLWAAKDFAGGLGLAGGARYVGEQFIDEDNAFAIDDYITLDAAVTYGRDNWRLRLNLKNLTDTDYEVRGFGSGSVIPADPFTAFLAVELRM